MGSIIVRQRFNEYGRLQIRDKRTDPSIMKEENCFIPILLSNLSLSSLPFLSPISHLSADRFLSVAIMAILPVKSKPAVPVLTGPTWAVDKYVSPSLPFLPVADS
jgi:hypothetical protein